MENSKGLLDSVDAEMDDIISEFAKVEKTTDIVELSDSGSEMDYAVDEFSKTQGNEKVKVILSSDDDEIGNFLEEFREENASESSSKEKTDPICNDQKDTEPEIICVDNKEEIICVDNKKEIIFDDEFEISFSDDDEKSNEISIPSDILSKLSTDEISNDSIKIGNVKDISVCNIKKDQKTEITSHSEAALPSDSCKTSSINKDFKNKSSVEFKENVQNKAHEKELSLNDNAIVCNNLAITVNFDKKQYAKNAGENAPLVTINISNHPGTQNSEISEQTLIKCEKESMLQTTGSSMLAGDKAGEFNLNKDNSKVSNVKIEIKAEYEKNSDAFSNEMIVSDKEEIKYSSNESQLLSDNNQNIQEPCESLENNEEKREIILILNEIIKKLGVQDNCEKNQNTKVSLENESKSSTLKEKSLSLLKDLTDSENADLESSHQKVGEKIEIPVSERIFSNISDESISKDEYSEKNSNSDINSSNKRKSIFDEDRELLKKRKEETEIVISDLSEEKIANKTEEEKETKDEPEIISFLSEENMSNGIEKLDSTKDEAEIVILGLSEKISNEVKMEDATKDKVVLNVPEEKMSKKMEKEDTTKDEIEIILDVSNEKISDEIVEEENIKQGQERQSISEDDTFLVIDDIDEDKGGSFSKTEMSQKEGIEDGQKKEENELISQIETEEILKDIEEILKETEELTKIKINSLLKGDFEFIMAASKKDLDEAALRIFQDVFEERFGEKIREAKEEYEKLLECHKILNINFNRFHNEFFELRVIQRTKFNKLNYSKPVQRSVRVSVNHKFPDPEMKIKPTEMLKTEVSVKGKVTNESKINPPVVSIADIPKTVPQNRPVKDKLIPSQSFPTIWPNMNIKQDVLIATTKIPPPNVIKCGDRLIPYVPVPSKTSPIRATVQNLPINKLPSGTLASIATGNVKRDVNPRAPAILQGSNVLVPLDKFLQMLPTGQNAPLFIRQGPTQVIPPLPPNARYAVQETTVRGQLQPSQSVTLHRVPVPPGIKQMAVRQVVHTKLNVTQAGGPISWSYRNDTRKIVPHTLTANAPKVINLDISAPAQFGTVSIQQSPNHLQPSRTPLLSSSISKVLSSSSSTTVTYSSSKFSYPPLPDTPHYDDNSVKPVPPKPSLKINKKEDGKGICLIWDLVLTNKHANVTYYQMYSCIDSQGWRKTGDIKALVLPMACTLQNFNSNTTYHFIIRAVDTFQRFGPFSDPVMVKF